MTKSQYINRWKAFNKRYEDLYTVQFNKALKAMVQDHINGKPVVMTGLLSELRNLYTTVGRTWGAFIQSQIGVRSRQQVKARMPMGFSERIAALMRQAYGSDYFLNDAQEITESLQQAISDVLSRAATEGLSNDEIVDILQLPDFTAMRARRIARTEVGTAANGAAVIVAKDQGVPMTKEWISVEDKRTRHSHRNIDGSVVDIDAAFDLGGVMMSQPGARKQPDGQSVPAREVINCRCTIAFKAKRDANGRLLRAG